MLYVILHLFSFSSPPRKTRILGPAVGPVIEFPLSLQVSPLSIGFPDAAALFQTIPGMLMVESVD